MGEKKVYIKKSIFIRKNFVGKIKETEKLALFDLDDTLIKYPVHQRLSNKTNWVFLYDNTFTKLQEVNREGFFVGIISNQFGLKYFKKSFIPKLDEFLSRFNFQVIFIGTMKHDYFRKPLPGTFEYLKKNYFSRIDPCSFYVGDAAGRYSKASRDHSCCDIKFAYNCRLRFFTPEAFFKGCKSVPPLRIFDPKTYNSLLCFEGHKDVLVVFGKGKHSGKRFFLQKYFPEHERHTKDKIHFLQKSLLRKVAFLDIQKFAELKALIDLCGSENIKCIFLDYDPHVVHYLRVFSRVTGKTSEHKTRNNEFKKFFLLFETFYNKEESTDARRSKLKNTFLSMFGLELDIVNFVFDDSGYTSFEKKTSMFQL